jgi:hypothetical protein
MIKFPKVVSVAYINEMSDDNKRVWFEGECELLPIITNVAELAGELVVFYGETKSDVIGQIVSALQAKGLTGTFKVIGNC